MSESDLAERTFDPTPKRKEQFRKEGQIPKSKDATAALGLLFSTAAVIGFRDTITSAVKQAFDVTYTQVGSGQIWATWILCLHAFTICALPIAVGAALGGVVAGLAQSRFQVELGLIDFKLERLNPLPNIQRLLSLKHGLRETLVAIVKVALIGGVATSALQGELDTILSTSAIYSISGAVVIANSVASLMLKIGAAVTILAAMDYALSYWDISKKMKMTLQEIKDEMRSEDGDPKVKSRIRARARALSKRRMMADIKTASAIVTNPTHYAVAIRYTATDGAPVVVAKGTDDVALAIRTEARKHGILIVENRALARTLHAEVAVGRPIKSEHFAAVARVLAYVFKVSAKHRPEAGQRRRSHTRPARLGQSHNTANGSSQ